MTGGFAKHFGLLAKVAQAQDSVLVRQLTESGAYICDPQDSTELEMRTGI